MTGGEQKPLEKYNAKTRTWHTDDKTSTKITAIFDIENGKSGWIRFIEGTAPDFRMVPMAALVAGRLTPPCRPTSTPRASRCSSAVSG